MCINLETSLTAFIIGELSGYFLIKNKGNVQLGRFIMFFSLIQLIEALAYLNVDQKIITKLLIIALGFQGIVFFPKNILLLGIAIYSLYFAFIDKSPKSINMKSCTKWNFDRKHIWLMYLIIYILAFMKREKIYNKMIILTLITLVFTKYTPCWASYWCLTSALVSPLMLL